jgi:hypothetical protein
VPVVQSDFFTGNLNNLHRHKIETGTHASVYDVHVSKFPCSPGTGKAAIQRVCQPKH